MGSVGHMVLPGHSLFLADPALGAVLGQSTAGRSRTAEIRLCRGRAQSRAMPGGREQFGIACSHAFKELLVLLVAPAALHLAVELTQDLILKLQRDERERS